MLKQYSQSKSAENSLYPSHSIDHRYLFGVVLNSLGISNDGVK